MPLKHYIGSYLVSLLLANFIVLEKGIELWKTNQTLDSMIPFFFFLKDIWIQYLQAVHFIKD